jgi:hypothetical protein
MSTYDLAFHSSSFLTFCSFLTEMLAVLQKHTSMNLADRLINRASRLENLHKYNRLIDDFNTDFLACHYLSSDYLGSFQL